MLKEVLQHWHGGRAAMTIQHHWRVRQNTQIARRMRRDMIRHYYEFVARDPTLHRHCKPWWLHRGMKPWDSLDPPPLDGWDLLDPPPLDGWVKLSLLSLVAGGRSCRFCRL